MSVSTAPEPRYGSTSRAYCRGERSTTTFAFAGCENHNAPRVNYWRCSPCGLLRIQMADMPDTEGFVRYVVNAKLRVTATVEYGDERSLDYEDILSEARELLWGFYRRWQPERGLTFMSYASHYLPLRLTQWWRRRYGLPGRPKPLAGAVSLDVEADQGSERVILGAAGAGGADSGDLSFSALRFMLSERAGRGDRRAGQGGQAQGAASAS